MTVVARLNGDNTFELNGKLVELAPETIFEDDFSDGVKKSDWIFETWGAVPARMGNRPSNGGWQIFHDSVIGHGSGALYAPMPNKNGGKVIVQFDWQPMIQDGSYRGSFFRIRGTSYSRVSTYGRTSVASEQNYLELSAYASSVVRVSTGGSFDLSPAITQLANYKIVCDIDNSQVEIYVNGVLERTFYSVYIQGLFLEFSYGAYQTETATFFDNVSILWEPSEKEGISISSQGDIEVDSLIEGLPNLSFQGQSIMVNEMIGIVQLKVGSTINGLAIADENDVLRVSNAVK